MSKAAPRPHRLMLWLAVAAGLALLVGANVHLVYVATTSQPDCVAHARDGAGAAANPHAVRRRR